MTFYPSQYYMNLRSSYSMHLHTINIIQMGTTYCPCIQTDGPIKMVNCTYSLHLFSRLNINLSTTKLTIITRPGNLFNETWMTHYLLSSVKPCIIQSMETIRIIYNYVRSHFTKTINSLEFELCEISEKGMLIVIWTTLFT